MSFRTLFTKTLKGSSTTWLRETVGPTPEFLAECSNLTPRVMYCVVNGWNQYMTDGFSGCKTEAEFHAKVDKNYHNVLNGLVRAATQAVVEKKTPLETEIIRIASEKVDENIAAKKAKIATYKAPTAAERSAIIEMVANDRYAEFAEMAKRNLAEKTKIADNSELRAMMDDLMSPIVAESAPTAPKNKKAA